MTPTTYALAAWFGFNLGLLAAAVHDYRAKRNDRREVDELCALIDVTRETGIPEDAWDESYRGAEVAAMHREPTPLADAAMDFLRRSMADLDEMQTVDDFLYLTGEEA